MSDIITTENISFHYGQRQALNGVTLSVKRGAFAGIIGPNGSGKTTLIKILTGILQPDAGSVTVDGRKIDDYDLEKLAQKMAYVPQSTVSNFAFTVEEIVFMGRHAYLESRVFERDEDIGIAVQSMEATDTLKFRDRYFNELSGGEMQRVVVASALAQEPDVLFLDEPTASLDIKYQMQIFELLTRLNREQGKTIVVSLHDLNLASMFCDFLVLLDQGRVVRTGKPDDVLLSDRLTNVYGIELEQISIDGNGRQILIPKRKA